MAPHERTMQMHQRDNSVLLDDYSQKDMHGSRRFSALEGLVDLYNTRPHKEGDWFHKSIPLDDISDMTLGLSVCFSKLLLKEIYKRRQFLSQSFVKIDLFARNPITNRRESSSRYSHV